MRTVLMVIICFVPPHNGVRGAWPEAWRIISWETAEQCHYMHKIFDHTGPRGSVHVACK